MKKVILMFLLISSLRLYAQQDDNSAIKLFVDPYYINNSNSHLETQQKDRLFQKTTQLINQTGIAEVGYSTFLVSPKFEVINESTSQTGVLNVYLAECELNITVERTGLDSQGGGAVFNSFTKSITGSGMSKAQAINNAINNISPNDPKIVAFLTITKAKINTYYQTHCGDVMKQAEQALGLKRYPLAIALYFSVPSNAPCYPQALAASEKVYKTYIEDDCNHSLIRLKAFVALANTETSAGAKTYPDSVLSIMSNLKPAADKCYAEATMLISKLESKLNEQQKQEWELLKKVVITNADSKKEMYKAIGRINSTYQPSTSADKTIIIR